MMDDAGWRELVRAGQAPFWRALAEGAGGEVIERGGVTAAIFPGAPNRSVFNSVFYEEGERLLGMLDELADAYEAAGISAWTVWVPAEDADVGRALEAAGHVDDAQPRDMAMAIADLRVPDADEELEIREEPDLAEMARINEIAYGWPAGDFGPVARGQMPGLRVYFGAVAGKTLGTIAVWAHDSDAEVAWVATLPEGRGRGISGRLMARALTDAREQGLETTTLVATKLGYPVYEKLGYRDVGITHMWERRKSE